MCKCKINTITQFYTPCKIVKNHVTSFWGLRGAQNKKREIELWDPPMINKFGDVGCKHTKGESLLFKKGDV